MAASYPTSAKSFTTKASADTIQAAHVNDLQDEVTAIETALLTSGFAHDVIVAATKKVYFDGGGNTYIVESSADKLDMVVGGSTRFRVDGETAAYLYAIPLILSATQKLYLDGGGSTYLTEVSDETLDIVVGGAVTIRTLPTYVRIPVNLYLDTASYFFLDGVGGNVYMSSPAGTDFDLYVNGTRHLRIVGGTGTYFQNTAVVLDATKKLYLDGGTNTYLHESAADTLGIVVGGTTTLSLTATAMTLLGSAVSFGANDSGGTGYRALVVANA